MHSKLLEYNLVSRLRQMSVCLLKAAKEAALEARVREAFKSAPIMV